MSEIICKHCGYKFDDQKKHCPTCQCPTPSEQDSDLTQRKKRFIYLFIGLVIFCAIMILWLPREINP